MKIESSDDRNAAPDKGESFMRQPVQFSGSYFGTSYEYRICVSRFQFRTPKSNQIDRFQICTKSQILSEVKKDELEVSLSCHEHAVVSAPRNFCYCTPTVRYFASVKAFTFWVALLIIILSTWPSTSLFKTLMMVFVLARKKAASLYNQHFLLRRFSLCFKSLTTIPNKDDGAAPVPPSERSITLHLSPFFSNFDHPPSGYNIELVDGDAWGVSSGVAQAWQGKHWATSAATSSGHQVIDEAVDCHPSHAEGEMDFEDIDNMRVHGNLFYKLERSSKEFEEYNLEFHRKKSSKKMDDNKRENAKEAKKAKTSTNPNVTSKDKLAKVHGIIRSESVIPRVDKINDIPPGNKRQRTPTFNQLTGPYHEPFCLDIYISKASVRACIVHRVTSKVVAVAHSISKDMKFDLASTKNKTTCAAVGAILAQRALADDIHDVIYTPRKGEKLQGKLQTVLQSIIDNGINVKVKIKQRPKRSIQPHLT